MSKYLSFNRIGQSPSGKTEIWGVYSIKQEVLLGQIRWFGRWRQYTFGPALGTTFNPDCLDSISEFIRGLMQDHAHDCSKGAYGGGGV